MSRLAAEVDRGVAARSASGSESVAQLSPLRRTRRPAQPRGVRPAQGTPARGPLPGGNAATDRRPAPRARREQAAGDGGATPPVGRRHDRDRAAGRLPGDRLRPARDRGLLPRVRRLRGQHRRHRGAAAHRRAARRARRDLRPDRCAAGRARRRRPVPWLPAVESPLPPRHRRHGAVTGDDRDQPAHVGPLGLPDQHRRCPPAPQLGARRPARRPRAHPRRTARRRPGGGARGDGAAHRHAPPRSSRPRPSRPAGAAERRQPEGPVLRRRRGSAQRTVTLSE